MEGNEQKRTKLAKSKMLEALEKSLGIVANALKIADISKSQYYEWLKVDEEFKSKVQDVGNTALDFAESKLFSQIKDNNHSSTQFYLKNKGRERGYGDKLDITSNDEAIKIHIDLGNKS